MNTEQVNNAYYNRFANEFEKIPFEEILIPLFFKYAGVLAEIRVLDVGSGPGALAKWLSEQGCFVTCLDPSLEMINRCQERGLNAIEGSLKTVKFKQKFDVIFAISSLIHVLKQDVLTHIQVAAESLNSKGVFFMSMLIGEGEQIEDPLNKGCNRYFNYFHENELETIFQEVNLVVLEKHFVESKKMGKLFALYTLSVSII